MKKILRFLVTLVLLAIVLGILGVMFCRQLLIAGTDKPKPAQVIVVLGGGSEERAVRAAELMRLGYAPRAIITGDGESGKGAHSMHAQMRKAGVHESRIAEEQKATTTRENATFTVPLLRAQKVTNAIIVTSWYHSRRGLACFENAAPEIKFQSVPTKAAINEHGLPSWTDTQYVLSEYGKMAFYAVKWRIFPW